MYGCVMKRAFFGGLPIVYGFTSGGDGEEGAEGCKQAR